MVQRKTTDTCMFILSNKLTELTPLGGWTVNYFFLEVDDIIICANNDNLSFLPILMSFFLSVFTALPKTLFSM